MTELPETLQRAPKRRQVFEFIKAEIATGRPFPSNEVIAAHMGWKHAHSVYDCLGALAGLDRVLKRTIVKSTAHTTGYAFSLK